MDNNFKHYKDDIRKTFTVYALIPVIIITFSSYVLSFSILYRSITARNQEINAETAKTVGTIIGAYIKQVDELSRNEKIIACIESKKANSKVYEMLYDFLNSMELKGNFFAFDKDVHCLIETSNSIPEYAQGEYASSWGIIRRMLDTPEQVVIARQASITSGKKTLSVGKTIIKEGSVIGFVTFDMDSKDLVRLISQNYSNSAVVTDKFGYVIACTNELLVNQSGKIDINFRDRSGIIRTEDDRHYVSRMEILDGEISIYTFTSIGYFNPILILTGVLLILLFGMLTLTTYLSAKKIANNKTQVIDDIIKAIENVQNGNLDTRLKVNTNNEFQVFAEAYNQMLTDIKNLIEVNKEKARQTALSEIKQLESQFNPHFLFNTLEMIRYMVKMDPNSVNKIIVGLSELLRYSINNTISEISLGEDIEYTKNYLMIQKYRFGEKFNYKIEMDDEDTYDCIVPKLLVQPMIENALKYGFVNRQSLSVQIRADFVNENLVIVIYDDGNGMETEVLEMIRQILNGSRNDTAHIGLYNVHRRIQLMYGDKYGVDILSQKGNGTVVKIILPVKRSRDLHA